jgi:hypothetical protein
MLSHNPNFDHSIPFPLTEEQKLLFNSDKLNNLNLLGMHQQ